MHPVSRLFPVTGPVNRVRSKLILSITLFLVLSRTNVAELRAVAGPSEHGVEQANGEVPLLTETEEKHVESTEKIRIRADPDPGSVEGFWPMFSSFERGAFMVPFVLPYHV